jgi:hypothetical protein
MVKRTYARVGVASLVLASGLLAGSASAQPIPRDPVTAEALFVDGKRLMQGHDYGVACPKLAESQRLDPSGGTIFALALCYEGAGKVATAWATFNDALSEARRDQRADREAAAAEHVKVLEQQLTRVRVDVPHPVAGLEVLRNGVPVDQVLWSTAIPLDPGTYTFEARAPGKVTWTWSTTINRPGDVFRFSIPELSNVPSAAVATVVLAPVAPAGAASVAPSEHTRSWVAPAIAAGVAVVAAGVGLGLGLKASSDWKTAQADTSVNRVNEASSAGTEADVATGFWVASGVALAVSGVLVAISLSSSDDSKSAEKARTAFHVVPAVGPGVFGLSFGGAL